MKIELTDDEYKIIYNYANAQTNNPCRGCGYDSNSTCCGCDREKEFTSNYELTINNFKILHEQNPTIIDDIEKKIATYLDLQVRFMEAYFNYTNYLQSLESDNDLYNFITSSTLAKGMQELVK
jgi:hypothetical protein